MKISEEQVRYAIETQKAKVGELATGTIYDKTFKGSAEADLIKRVSAEASNMPEVREELVAKLKAAVDAGEYKVSADDIVDAMIRREAADQTR